MTAIFRSLLIALGCIATPVLAVASPECRQIDSGGNGFTACSVDDPSSLRLWLKDADGQVYGSFSKLADDLAHSGQTLTFAMNAGMYHSDRRPVGLYRENGENTASLVTSKGPGNFGMLPNGVLCIDDDRVEVIETLDFDQRQPKCRFATQSGPMLLIDGQFHPRFLRDSDSRKIRNGVGVDEAGRAHFVLSDRPVTFWEFATLFRDVLNTPNALYLDGTISRLYAPSIHRDDLGFPMGPIVGTVAPSG
ncbi:phosphodiester glycosidase family protein [Qingshengfaniella alkalisoli]|uniref:Phosphodiester glycosidase domain-containing protein n=1 Tax=Qingshengfaniella alkalisoli TaxID=2599296 RepID=A0A5B8I545_9RHOB|nr:phosphodiester glycosidase family protein [Qingshengfaniella alkalisoli]QDY68369.1 hypothetical protein FPZ52_01185 [Qingshengfaniella alkalisoli]